MKVPIIIYANKNLILKMNNSVFEQLFNIAFLPGVIKYIYCMPDSYKGYEFPIDGVTAMNLNKGVISSGGIGLDINCGVRLISSNLNYNEVKPKLNMLMTELFNTIPTGKYNQGGISLSKSEFKDILNNGAKWLVEKGFGGNNDLGTTEDNGCISGANISNVSQKAIEIGCQQVITLGFGNYYIEIQIIDDTNIFDKKIANKLNINKLGKIFIMFHCESREFGHQITTEYLKKILKTSTLKYNIKPINKELVYAPFLSRNGQKYFSAMKCAANMAYANRQIILYKIRKVFKKIFAKTTREVQLTQIYDVCHNIAKIKKHEINGQIKNILIHRKGATRAWGPNTPQIPKKYANIGQPILIGRSMEIESYLLVGTNEAKETFYSAAHGNRRTMSRSKARKNLNYKTIIFNMNRRQICIKTKHPKLLVEEAEDAYKNINEIVKILKDNNIYKPIIKLKPIGSIKG